MKKNKISKNWINRQKKDIYVRQSKIEGFRSRAIYKLKEIDEKFKIFKQVNSVVDLGAAPGSWSQYAATRVKSEKILSIDLLKFEKIKNSHQIIGDFTDEKYKNKIREYFGKKIDLIISDMAANTTGNKDLDCIRTNQLCMEVITFSSKILKNNGIVIAKLFMGQDFLDVKKLAKEKFKNVQFFKPESSRDESKETYIHCSSLKTL